MLLLKIVDGSRTGRGTFVISDELSRRKYCFYVPRRANSRRHIRYDEDDGSHPPDSCSGTTCSEKRKKKRQCTSMSSGGSERRRQTVGTPSGQSRRSRRCVPLPSRPLIVQRGPKASLSLESSARESCGCQSESRTSGSSWFHHEESAGQIGILNFAIGEDWVSSRPLKSMKSRENT